LKYIGIAIFIFGAGAFVGSYTSYLKRRVAEHEAFLSLVSYMRIQIGCFMRPPLELIRGFESEALEKTGFLEALERSSDMSGAYREICGTLLIGDKARGVLDGLFSSLGEVYYDESVRLLDNAREELERACESERGSAAKNRRLVSALSVTVTLAIIMLII
jgi:hypothetical protein